MAQRSTQKTGSERIQLGVGNAPNKMSSEPLPEIWVPAQPAAKKRNGWPATRNLLIGGLLFFICTAFLLLFVVLGQIVYSSEMIFPGVDVMGIDLGAATKSEAETRLLQKWEQQSILLSHDESVWPVGVTDLGLAINAQATVEEAYKQGRSVSGLRQLITGRGHVQPIWTVDPLIAAAFLESFSPQINVQPVNAGFQIQDGEIVETPPMDGQALDLEMTVRQLQENPETVLANGRLPIITRPISPDINDVSHLTAEARQLLSTTVTIQAYDPIRDETVEWAGGPKQWGSWLSLKLSEEGEFEWDVDQEAAQVYLSDQLPDLGSDRYVSTEEIIPELVNAVSNQQTVVEARIYHAPRRHIVQSGETLSSIGRDYGIPYPWIQQANPGSELLFAGNELVIPSPDEMLPLSVVKNKRVAISLSEQRAWVYEDGQIKWEWPVSTGIDSSPTAPGIFQIQNHETNAYASNWDLWMPNFMGIYRPLPTSDFMNGFHGFPTRNGSNLLWTGDLGHQVTYGCILLSSENASQLYDWAEEGVVVEIKP